MALSKFQEMINAAKNATPAERRLFNGTAMKLAIEKLNASFHDGDESGKFLDKIYSEFQECKEQKNLRSWIFNRVKNSFASISSPPKWIADEPSWPFMNAEPMIFVGQIDVPKNDDFGGERSIYIFCAKKLNNGSDGNYSIEHKMVIQYKGLGPSKVIKK